MTPSLESVLHYHELSKHGFRAFAPGPGHLDWANQPNPFRRYEGAPLISLDRPPIGDRTAAPHYEPALLSNAIAPVPMNYGSVSQLLFDSLALSAWKSHGGQKWALRVNPSSGNLHPTEGYWISGPVTGLCKDPIIAHYSPLEHLLEVRTELSNSAWRELAGKSPEGTGFIALTSIYWREAWKYGERAFRYCQHDVGHAIAAVSIASAALGWTVRLVDHWSQEDLRILLGLSATPGPDGAEAEHPDCLLAIIPSQAGKAQPNPPPPAHAINTWRGKPNRLSAEHRSWTGIEKVVGACEKPRTSPDTYDLVHRGRGPAVEKRLHSTDREPLSLRRIIHQRRSAVDFDGQGGITRKAFYDILEKTMLAAHRRPFDALPWAPHIHLGLYVHRVQDLDPGLYFLVRNPEHLNTLKSLMNPDFVWKKPEGHPPDLELYRLLTGDARQLAKEVSCQQDIAADGALSLGMIAEFERPLRDLGPWFYPRLFWEAGAIGQTLYLEAEAIGIRGTGIGCFFDNPVHRTFGLTDRTYQSLYHFTMGTPVEDTRLALLPAYP